MSTRDNGKPAIPASKLLTDFVTIGARDWRLVRCDECSRWVAVHRHLINVHRATEEVEADGSRPRCGRSLQRLVFDLDDAEWAARFQGASQDTDRRRPTRVHHKPTPPVARPVHLLAAR